MKKLSKILVVLIVLIMAFSLSACGDKDNAESNTDDVAEIVEETIEGKFVLSAMKEGEVEISKDQIVEMGGNDFFIEFSKDKTFMISVTDEQLSGEYSVDGENVTMTMEGETEPLHAKLVGNDFIIDDEGMKMTFTRQ